MKGLRDEVAATVADATAAARQSTSQEESTTETQTFASAPDATTNASQSTDPDESTTETQTVASAPSQETAHRASANLAIYDALMKRAKLTPGSRLGHNALSPPPAYTIGTGCAPGIVRWLKEAPERASKKKVDEGMTGTEASASTQ